ATGFRSFMGDLRSEAFAPGRGDERCEQGFEARNTDGSMQVGADRALEREQIVDAAPKKQPTVYHRIEHRELPLEQIREQRARGRDLHARGTGSAPNVDAPSARADEEHFVVDANHDGNAREPLCDVAVRRLRLAGEQRVRAAELFEHTRFRHAETRRRRDSRRPGPSPRWRPARTRGLSPLEWRSGPDRARAARGFARPYAPRTRPPRDRNRAGRARRAAEERRCRFPAKAGRARPAP